MKRNILNVILLVGTYFLPLYLLRTQEDVSISIASVGLIFVFIGGVVLTYLNNKYRKQALIRKWWWTTFQIMGIIGILYSFSFLVILFGLRNCCGF